MCCLQGCFDGSSMKIVELDGTEWRHSCLQQENRWTMKKESVHFSARNIHSFDLTETFDIPKTSQWPTWNRCLNVSFIYLRITKNHAVQTKALDQFSLCRSYLSIQLYALRHAIDSIITREIHTNTTMFFASLKCYVYVCVCSCVEIYLIELFFCFIVHRNIIIESINSVATAHR